MKKVIMGNHAASWGALLSRVQVIAAYPITPQTQIVEELSEMCADGRLHAKFIKVESEHSALASIIGASTAGARAFTATSAQGLALMHELLHWAAGARLPIVMVNVNRAMAPGWSIWSDQNDSLSQRDTGWIQFYCEDNQEVLDTVIMGYKVAETVNLPVMICYDAFILSHTYEPVDIPDQELVDSFLPPPPKRPVLDVNDPRAFYPLVMPDNYMEYRYKMQVAMDRAKRVIEEVGEEFDKVFGRRYGLVETMDCDDAEVVLVSSSSFTSPARAAVMNLRKKGYPVGLLKIKTFRPFPTEKVREVLADKKKVVVADRNISFGKGGIFADEIKGALFNLPDRPVVFGCVIGLGGRDITPQALEEIVMDAMDKKVVESEIIWKGLKP
ncbi:MAG TPA: pyruvate ferredoxin oxidoreductase [Proteobacteria bacterium]|nr:pyruvate ferredoxin oxidoreductase [Pseudomonadota bacterium]